MRILLLLLPLLAAGCSRAYWTDRGRDALDVVTASVGAGIGFKAQAGILSTGLGVYGDGVVLRGGIRHQMGHALEDLGFQLVLMGTDPLYGVRKDSKSMSILGLTLPADIGTYKLDRGDLYVMTQIDAALYLGLGCRIGVNPGEFIDLLLGFTTLDIFDDDVEEERIIEERAKEEEKAREKERETKQVTSHSAE